MRQLLLSVAKPAFVDAAAEAISLVPARIKLPALTTLLIDGDVWRAGGVGAGVVVGGEGGAAAVDGDGADGHAVAEIVKDGGDVAADGGFDLNAMVAVTFTTGSADGASYSC